MTVIHIPWRKNSGADTASRYPTNMITNVAYKDDHSSESEQYNQVIALASLSLIDDLTSVTRNKVQNPTLSDYII